VSANLELAEQEARVALLVLRSNVKANPQSPFAIAPSSVNTSEADTVRYLASLEKPLECAASKVGSVVRVSCKTLKGHIRENFLARVSHRPERWEPTLRKLGADPIDEAAVMLRSDFGSVTIPFRALRAWYRDYFINHGLSYVGERLKPPPGVHLVLDVDDPAEITIDMISHDE